MARGGKASEGRAARSEFGRGLPSARIEVGIENSKGADGRFDGGKAYVSSLSNAQLASGLRATEAAYLQRAGYAGKYNAENPEASNYGSADSVADMAADSYHDNYYRPFRDELGKRFLNDEGKPFWEKTKEQTAQESENPAYRAEYKDFRILEAMMNIRISPESVSIQRVGTLRGERDSNDFSKVSTPILEKSVEIAQRGLDDMKRRVASVEAQRREKGLNSDLSDFVTAYQKEVVDPIVSEYRKRNEK